MSQPERSSSPLVTFQGCLKSAIITGLSLLCVEEQLHKGILCISNALFDTITTHDYPDLNKELLHQSYAAYSIIEDEYEQSRIARIVNGEIVPESDSDDSESYVGISEPLSESGKALIVKKRRAIQRRCKRKQEKAIAERHFLSRKDSTRVSKILKDCPDIGETIEAFVQEHQVGPDAWRPHWGTNIRWQHEGKRESHLQENLSASSE